MPKFPHPLRSQKGLRSDLPPHERGEGSFSSAIGRLFAEEGNFVGDRQALALEIVGDGTAKPRIPDPMRAIGLDGQVAAASLCAPWAPASTRASLCSMAKPMAW